MRNTQVKTVIDKTFRLKRRTPGLMAMEQRFMFDGAAMADATQTLVDAKVDNPSAIAYAQLALAEQAARTKAAEFLNQSTDQELFALFNGGQTAPDAEWHQRLSDIKAILSQTESPFVVRLMEQASQQSAVAAFASEGPEGKPTIFINPFWMGLLDDQDVANVLVEEVGHWIDSALNIGRDSSNDEGQIFAAKVNGFDATSGDVTQSDAGWVMAGGVSYQVEFASFNFVNAYQMVYDLDNDSATGTVDATDIDVNERWASKEQNLHYFNSSVSLGIVRITDGTGNQNFSGNDVSATSVVVNGTTYHGWISRPIKANGVVRGFYFWTDDRFNSLAAAQTDGNQDGDSTVVNNCGFVFVVDQAWFDSQITSTRVNYNGSSASTPVINNQKDGNLGSIWVANVGSSSDRVDSALNSVMVPNSAPVAANDTLTVAEDSGTTSVVVGGGLLSNDSDPNNDALTITGYTISGVSGTQSVGSNVTLSGVGVLRINSDGSYTFAPASNYSGPVPAITYTVSDGNGGSATAVLSITITPVNDPPISENDSVNVTINTPKILGITDFGNYSDQENDPFTSVRITSLPTSGSLQYWNGSSWTTLTGTPIVSTSDILQGNLRYQPATNVTGSPTLQFQVYDGSLYSTNSYTLTLVIAGNKAPTANADTNTVTEAGCGVSATASTGNVITGGTVDSDPDGGTLTITQIDAYGNALSVAAGSTSVSGGRSITGQYGTLTIGANGSYSYSLNNALPTIDAMNSGDSKTETFTYTLSDGQGGTTTSTLTLTINGTNDAPVAQNDFSYLQEGSLSGGNYGTVIGNALTNDTDVDGPGLTIGGSYASAVGNAAGATTYSFSVSNSIAVGYYVFFDDDGNATTSNVTLTNSGTGGEAIKLTVDYSGSTYDMLVASTSASGTTFKIVVSGVNVSVGLNDNKQGFVFGSGSGAVGFSGNADTSGNYKVSTISSQSNPSSTTVNISNISSGIIAAGMTVTDGTISRTVQTVTKNASGVVTSMTVDTAVTWSNANLTFSSTSSPLLLTGQYGNISINRTTGAYTYTLTSNALSDGNVFDEKFNYRATDGSCTSDATITVRITGATAPYLQNDRLVVSEDSGTHITFNGSPTGTDLLTTNDTNGTTVTLGNVASFKVAGDNTTYTAGQTATISGVGTLSIASNGAITFNPVDDYLGPVPEVTYTRRGNDSIDYIANLIITIDSVNDLSVLVADTNTVSEDQSAGGNVLSNDSDVDDTLTVDSYTWNNGSGTSNGTVGVATPIVLNGLTVGSLTLNANGSYTFTPSLDWNGTVPTISYTTNTGSTSTLDITVTPVNDPPVLDLDNSGSGTGWMTTYTNQGSASPIGDTDVLITDVDNTTISSAVIVLTNPQAGDALNFDQSVLSSYGITANSTSSGGVMTVTLTGSSLLANYQNAIKSITFSSTGTSTVDRVVSVKVNDGSLDSNTAYAVIDVNPDTRLVTVMGSVVNEASPYLMFEVTGVQNQWVSLLLETSGVGTGHAEAGKDYSPHSQYYNGSAWTDYAGGLVQITAASGKLMVRTAILQDAPFESTQNNYETLKLTAKNANGTANVTTDGSNFLADGTARIRDDGQGSIYLSGNTTFTPDTSGTGYPTYLDDDRTVSVNSILVNEGSPYAVLTISGYNGQILNLAWSDITAKKEANGTVATDGTDDYGPSLQYWDSTANTGQGAWVDYNGTSVTMSGTTLYVRTTVVNDTPFEGAETFALQVTKASSGAKVYGVATIVDDGSGTKYPDDNPTDGLATDTTGLNDDRTISVSGGLTFNELSTYATFTVSAIAGAEINLTLGTTGTGAGHADINGFSMDYSTDGGATWTAYTWNGASGNRPAVPANGSGFFGTVMVRVNISSEEEGVADVYEGLETFKLSAAYATNIGITAFDTDTISDDGTGKIDSNGDGGADEGGTKENDNSTSLAVTGGSFNEGSPRAVFTVNATAGMSLTLDVQDLADTGKAPTGDDEGGADDSLNNAPIYYSLDGGLNWTLYTGTAITAGSVPVLVAVDITGERDTVYEGEEQFKLVVTSGAQSASAFASIFDDGTGLVQQPNEPNPDPDAPKDDDRPVRVNNIEVNENSPWAVFRVNGTAGQSVTLALQNDSDPNTANATLGTDSGTQLQYFTGTAWVNYTGAVTLPTGGELLVRVAITDDDPYEGPETFQLSATPSGGSAAYGTATILDDGTGSIYPDNKTGNPDPDAPKDDDRPVRVNNIEVNENSPWAVFRVNGTAGQSVTLALQNDSDPNTANAKLGTDLGTQLQYFTGTAWVNYTGAVNLPTDGELLVRVAITDDDPYEGPETFQLSATPSGGSAAYGTATILDDGTGSIYPDNKTGNPDPDAVKDDDRPVRVNNIEVNENSPWAVFRVNGTAGQSVTLALQNDNDPNTANAKLGTDLGTQLQYFNGTAWVNYTGAVTLPTGGELLVRVAITDDDPYEGPETFQLSATPSGGSAAYGTATILDDGTGSIYPDNTTGNPDPDAVKDDDRPLKVNNIEVNENSPWAVFRVNGTVGQSVTLALQNDNDPNTANAKLGTDLGTQLQYFNGTAWVNYTGAVTLPTGGELLVRVAITDDDPYEGPETFQLSATPSGGSAAYGTATILDDGTGNIYPDNPTGAIDPAASLDDDRPLKVNNIEVNENSPWAVFRVNGTVGQSVTLALQNDNDPNTANAKLGTDLGTQLQYYTGTAWVNYTGAVNLPTGGELLVRVAITDDDPYEGPETFQLSATPSGGSAAYGTATILDDGTGNIYPDNPTGATDPAASLDDDRPVQAPPPSPPVVPPAPPAPPANLTPPPPPAPPAIVFSSTLNPVAPALVPVDPPRPLGDAVTSGSGYQIPVSETAPPGLTLYQGVTDQFVQSTSTVSRVSLPFDAFIHSNKDAVIKLDAKLADDSRLPNWVQFDPASGTFQVTPPANFKGKLDIKVVARDDDGREAVAIFQMFIGEQSQTPTGPQSRESFSEKLRLAGKRPITWVKVSESSTVRAPLSTREVSTVQRARVG